MSDTELDRTMVHEMMHAFMEDYTRTGMNDVCYDEATGLIRPDYGNMFPQWFREGIATSVGSPYQRWVSEFRNDYRYDAANMAYDAETLKSVYLSDEKYRLGYAEKHPLQPDTTRSSYMAGYLACVYLGALASAAYDDQPAVTTNTEGSTAFNSQYVLNGLDHILEKLHGGNSLDSIIKEISTTTTDSGSTTMWKEDNGITDSSAAAGSSDETADQMQEAANIVPTW